ncbi:MAG: hypothetical protein OEZ01_03640 [Candidatus Heimdallarchaeota archaeon]|nr:hypothetical protein [Candidatus Heimdallarchaeota archaeon]MDH5645071.1 hypothetical protein [Candidatus Heimdallarchaeota archaeon]
MYSNWLESSKNSYLDDLNHGIELLFNDCDFKEAVNLFIQLKTSLTELAEFNDDELKLQVYLNYYLGLGFHHQGLFDQSREVLLESIRIYEMIKDENLYLLIDIVLTLVELESFYNNQEQIKQYYLLLKPYYDEIEHYTQGDVGLRLKLTNSVITIEGLYYKLSNTNRDRLKAEDLFRKLLSDTTIMDNYKYYILPHLIELLLLEWKLYRSPEIFDEIISLIKIIENINRDILTGCYYKRSDISLLLIKAKIGVVSGDFNLAWEIYEQAKQLAINMDFKDLIIHIKEEVDDLNQEFTKLKNIVNTNQEMATELEAENLLTYIEAVLQFSKKN